MNAATSGLIEIAVIVVAIPLWLAGVFAVMYRGFILPSVKMDDIRFEVAERQGLFFDGVQHDRHPRTEEELRQQAAEDALRSLASSEGESRRLAIWQAWRSDPDFKAEVQRRYREYYPWRHTYIALLCGGVWSLTFIAAEPLQDMLVPDGIDALFPVWVLVAPLWVAFAVMLVLEGIKAAERRSERKHA